MSFLVIFIVITCIKLLTSIKRLVGNSPNVTFKYKFDCIWVPSLRTADVFPVVASLFFGGREVTTGNSSVGRRLPYD